MARLSRPQRLIVIGLVSVGLTLALFAFLTREVTVHPRRPVWDEAAIMEGMKQLQARKEACEQKILNAILENRPHYEAIVRAVEKQGLKPGERMDFSFPKKGAPEHLRQVVESFDRAELGRYCDENTLIHARCLDNGGLRVNIIVCEMGHAGTYSVLYTSWEMSKKETESAEFGPSAFSQLDPHWWAVVTWY